MASRISIGTRACIMQPQQGKAFLKSVENDMTKVVWVKVAT
jgi:hypothetical protein